MKELHNYGIMRGGIHSFLLWILNKYINQNIKIIYYNNVYDLNILNTRIIKKDDSRLINLKNQITEDHNEANLKIYSFESRLIKDFINNNPKITNTIIIRNPYNNYASCLEYVKNGGKSQTILKMIDVKYFKYIWSQLAKEFLNETNFANNKICIKYDKFILDSEYRCNISKKLELNPDIDILKKSHNYNNNVNEWRWGSSFKNTKTNFHNRYLDHINNPEMQKLINDPEIIQLWTQIQVKN
jgi:hypothetical protein